MSFHSPAPSLSWCLFLDVDGTLVELTETPFDTHGSRALTALLDRVARRLDGAVAMVSGRGIAYLDALFAPLRLPCAGLHGIERREASGVMHGASFDDVRLDAARIALADMVLRHPGTLLEDKGRTLAVHYRMAPQFEPAVREAVLESTAPLERDYHVQAGNMLFEIKPKGSNKGTAVKAFMREPPFMGRRPVYIGDDLTDLDGFRVVDDGGGVSIAVGDRIDGQYRLENPAAVREWLHDIADLAPSGR